MFLKGLRRVLGIGLEIWGGIRLVVDVLESIDATRQYAHTAYVELLKAPSSRTLTIAVIAVGASLLLYEPIRNWWIKKNDIDIASPTGIPATPLSPQLAKPLTLSDETRKLADDLLKFVDANRRPDTTGMTDFDAIIAKTGPPVHKLHFGYKADFEDHVNKILNRLAAEGIYDVFDNDPQIRTEKNIRELVTRLDGLADRLELKQPIAVSLTDTDPKIYLEPLNSEFVPPGTIPFNISNKGQRADVAHNIEIQPINVASSISFDYVDHLDVAQPKKIIPRVANKNPFLSDNVLGVLEGAFNQSGQIETMKLLFEIKIRYQDVTGLRKFESTVKMAYCPIEHRNAQQQRRNVVPHVEYKIIKLCETTIKRLA